MNILFVYPESYLNIGIPGGISILSVLLKKEGHSVDLFDTTLIKTNEMNKTNKNDKTTKTTKTTQTTKSCENKPNE